MRIFFRRICAQTPRDRGREVAGSRRENSSLENSDTSGGPAIPTSKIESRLSPDASLSCWCRRLYPPIPGGVLNLANYRQARFEPPLIGRFASSSPRERGSGARGSGAAVREKASGLPGSLLIRTLPNPPWISSQSLGVKERIRESPLASIAS